MSQAPTHAIHGEGESHGTFASYIIGFIIAAVLTVAAFAAVMMHAMSPGVTLGVITVLAVIQIFVHLVYFLHMNGSSSQSWNLTAFVFAVACVLIVVGGTIFILHDTSMNMMSR
ncbi:cytochrome o ubiquinol oxidase subunit IV [Kozakia baliensis]|uniref:Cytochrome bo(3) ubiquinol oxidase subunit 4 n=1 Tax=Kozakia baliensis TaxID=153496 RepID=A0A1D8URY7_9PROT|nr:cytochrome o ubiquinol oxidase subunit IV [Kozakia baliensis]AOX16401.1 cytochrome o ubiquinol oxidase subunit IV [Kozakia baliensis]GBR28870.1 cytochrome o ubiquinol oxidase subunit IV [Kozakia baliensis NRIC 0488]GEL63522.1 cytochrome o ubiquinol oxidase subunit IV [Kozakia baliensis]